MIWLVAIGLGLLVLGAGGGRTFGPRTGLAKRAIPKGTSYVVWIDDARSVALYRKDGKIFASVSNGSTEDIGPLPEDAPFDDVLEGALKWSEFANSPVRYERLDGKRSWHVTPAADGWHWVAQVRAVVQSGVAPTREQALLDVWSVEAVA